MTTSTSPFAAAKPPITAEARPALPVRRITRTGCLPPRRAAISATRPALEVSARPRPPRRNPPACRTTDVRLPAACPVPLSVEPPFARPDVYPSGQLGLPAPRAHRAVITVHDLAPLRWPEHYLRLPHARFGHAWEYALARRADAVIAVSEATKRDVVELLHVPESQVTVIPEAVDAAFAPPSRDEA